MRLVKTQANATKKRLKEAEALVLEALKNNSVKGLRANLIRILGELPKDALKIVEELSLYEARFTKRILVKNIKKEIKPVAEDVVVKNVRKSNVRVALKRPAQTIEDTYKSFGIAKALQYAQVVTDAKILKEDVTVTKSKVVNLTNGLFTRQNLAIAGISIIGAANLTRELVIFANGMKVQWSAILDEATCSYCEDQDGTIYEEETDDIPAHANCRCTWIPIE